MSVAAVLKTLRFVYFAIFFTAVGIVVFCPYEYSYLPPPPALKYKPVPPSCCGDSICLLEHHHD